MRGLDTNVIVRFVTKDNAEQFKRADAVFARAASSGEKLLVDGIVLCEVVWVLRSAYQEPKEAIVRVLASLLETPEVVVAESDLARRALADYADGAGDFADYLIAQRNRRAGCETTLTFDRDLRACDDFTAV